MVPSTLRRIRVVAAVRCLTMLVIANTAIATTRAAAGSEAERWELAGAYRFNEANDGFTAAGASAGSERHTWLAQAATLINRQPKHESNVDRAEELLHAVVAANATDNDGLVARYLLGRINEVHRTPARNAEARQIYEQLAATGSDHLLVQRAILQLALLVLYQDPAPVASRLAKTEELIAKLVRPSARSDGHILIARSYLFFRTAPERAREHLVSALELGIAGDRQRSDALVSVIELSRDQGRTTDAGNFSEEFLRQFPRDVRSTTIRARLGPGNAKLTLTR